MIQTLQASHHHHASPSSSASFAINPAPPTPTSPLRIPTHVQAIHHFDPSLLASTSTASFNPNMYLNFRAGEIIRVHVRDGTGWWDGEISTAVEKEARVGPRRGWFPSNYVREMGWDGSLHRRSESASNSVSATQSVPGNHSRQTSAASHHSRTSTSSSISAAHTVSSTSRSPANLLPALQALLHPVVQSLSLLESAIHSNRKPHIQPSTACVISSIRAALMQTDCLSKESTTLVSFPILAKERKVVLVELSKLVGCARSASGVEGPGDETQVDDVKEMNALAKAARGVFASVKRFLHLANDCGVKPVVVEPGEVAAVGEGGLPTPASSQHPPPSFDPSATKESRIREPSTGTLRMQEAFRLKAASIGDLRATRRRVSSPPPPMPTVPGLGSLRISRTRSPSATSTPMSATFASSSGSGSSSPISTKSLRDRRLQGSMDSGSFHSHATSSDLCHPWEPSTPVPTPPPTAKKSLDSTPDVYEAISLAEDALLSIIAAFIGHVHSHHIGSHPSSHAHIIEMTREAIDAVRQLLTIVEAVGRNAGVRLSRPRDIDHMRMAKDNLYDVAARLVEGAEVVANAPFSELGEDDYEIQKGRLLQAATGTLRAGTECVRLVKLCIPDKDTPHIKGTPRQGDGHARQSTPRPSHDSAVVLREGVVGARGLHTLSALHRKASSLGALQQRYQEDDNLVHAPDEEEENENDDDEDQEIVQDVSREEDMTVRPVALIRPPLLQAVTAPVIPLAIKEAESMLWSCSDDTGATPRSRSSSLISPVPMPRFQHRSPSRSADLDRFTSDLERPRQIASAATVTSAYTASTAESSIRSSGISEFQPPAPQTPHADSRILTYFTSEVASFGSVPKLASLSIENEPVETPPVKARLLQRPSPPVRSSTAPIPSANSDVRFWIVAHDYDPRDITFNSEGNMIGASLSVLVEKMTPHDGPVDPTFWASFFYTFRLFTSPVLLLAAMMARYDLQPPPSIALGERERAVWIERKVVPVRLRIYNFLKAWLDTYWRSETDAVVLDGTRDFAIAVVSRTLPAMGPRLLEAVRRRQSGHVPSNPESGSLKRLSSTERLRAQAGVTYPPPMAGSLPPTPIISKSLNSLLQKNALIISITDFDTLELARQFTIMESKLFCAVVPEDLLQTGKKTIPSLKALSTLSNQITGWVADNVLNEQDAKKRAALLKFYIKLADKCLTLRNFSTLFAVLAGLNSSIVLRLKKTWDALSSKYRVIMERLRGVIEHTKNHAAYRARLREVSGPCLPFLGLILSDITFTSEGNLDTRLSVLAPDLSLINHDKYAKLGRIAMDFRRYQEPFNFHELAAVQILLKRVLAERGSGSLDALYRKSLLLEPRQGSEKLSSAVEKPGWLGGKI